MTESINNFEKNVFVFLCLIFITVGQIYAAPADYDSTFGSNGRVNTSFNNQKSGFNDSVTQSDGKIIAAGYAVVANDGFQNAIVRFNRDGSPDASFGSGGRVLTNIASGYDFIDAVALQADGRIIAAGFGRDDNGVGLLTIARYNSNGTLDTTFDGDGKLSMNIGTISTFGDDVIVQPDGRIIVVGSTGISTNSYSVLLVRFNPNGTLDSTFGNNGIKIQPIGQSAFAQSVALAPNGKILIGGSARFNGKYNFLLARFTSTGDYDPDFAFAPAIGSGDDGAMTLALSPNGKITLGGYTTTTTGSKNFALVRYTPDGVMDTTFDGDGIVTTDFNNQIDEISRISVQPDGKIAAIGKSDNGTINELAIARYNSDGSLDATFSGDGKHILTNGGADIEGFQIDVQPNGRLFIAGSATLGFVEQAFTARLLGRNTGGDYDGDGKTDIGIFRPSNGAWYLQRSQAGISIFSFGQNGDRPTPGDFDGDGRSDSAVFRPSNGVWYVLGSSAGFFAQQFGIAEDVPVAGDYDGDGKSDAAVFRPSTGIWHVMRSKLGYISYQFGLDGDKPVSGDFDRDGKADSAVFRPSNGVWYILRSGGGVSITQFGTAGDIPVVGDFDGDTGSDLGIFRPSNGTWHILRSSDGSYQSFQFGSSGDSPMAGDLDGDSKSDPTVFRPATGVWYTTKSTGGYNYYQFGSNGDIPVSDFLAR